MSGINTDQKSEMMERDMAMKLFNMLERKSRFDKLTQYVETISEKDERKTTDIRYICKVVDSCETVEQRENAINWGLDILSRLSRNE